MTLGTAMKDHTIIWTTVTASQNHRSEGFWACIILIEHGLTLNAYVFVVNMQVILASYISLIHHIH